MHISVTKPLFAWDCLDDSPDLATVRDFLHALPDARLLESLRAWRGRGRDDYPIAVLWGVVVLMPLLRHGSVEDTLADLRRNAALRALVGIESEEKVPRKWNVSRFQEVLGSPPHLGLLQEMFNSMIRRLAETVPQLGRTTAGDSTGLSARPPRSRRAAQGGLPQPAGGKKEYTDDEGKVTKVLQWFGYKLHLVVDVENEVALAYRVTSANRGDNELIPDLVAQARANLGDDVEPFPLQRRQELWKDRTG